MAVLRTILLTIAAASGSSLAAMQPDPAGSSSLPPSHQRGLDMEPSDSEAMPPEPELADDLLEFQEESWSGSPVDLLRPTHHLYTDLRRHLVRYQMNWSALPQVRIPVKNGPVGEEGADVRLIILRERLGLPPEGGLDEALRAKVAAYQQAHGLKSDGIAGTATVTSLNRGAAHYERRILLNLERLRRLPALGAARKYILVDAGSSRLWMYEDGRPVDSMRVIVGAPASETPMMASLIRYANINPYWNVPPELVQSLIAPRVIGEGSAYLAARGYEVLESWRDDAQVISPDTVDWRAVAKGDAEVRVRQLPGAGNSMGDVKFMMPNEHGIYLHDTPNKALFKQDNRWVSNGCVRVEDARRLAGWIFGEWPATQDASRETRVDLETPVPVYITYLTAAPEADRVSFRSDPYQRDDTLLARFDGMGDGMSDMPAEALASSLRAAAAAEQSRNAATPAPARTAAAPRPSPRQAAARTAATPAPRQSAARTPAKPPLRQGTVRNAASPARSRGAAATIATPKPERSAARPGGARTPGQVAARTSSVGRSTARTTSKPAAARNAATATPAPRANAGRSAANRQPARRAGQTTVTPEAQRRASRTAAAPAPRQAAARTTGSNAPTRAKPTSPAKPPTTTRPVRRSSEASIPERRRP